MARVMLPARRSPRNKSRCLRTLPTPLQPMKIYVDDQTLTDEIVDPSQVAARAGVLWRMNPLSSVRWENRG